MSGWFRQRDVSQAVYFPEARGPETEACFTIRIYRQGNWKFLLLDLVQNFAMSELDDPLNLRQEWTKYIWMFPASDISGN